MSTAYVCPDCGARVVLVSSGGVWREIICRDCNVEMEYDGRVETEYIGHEDPDNSYQIVEGDD